MLLAGILLAAALLSANSLQAAGLSSAERQIAAELASQTAWLTTVNQSKKQAVVPSTPPMVQYSPEQHPLRQPSLGRPPLGQSPLGESPLGESPLRQYPLGQSPLGTQTLSVELDEHKAKPALRRLRVYQFDYNRQYARMLLIDPATKRVIEQHRIDSVHLPLNDHEASFAMALLEADTSLFRQLQAERLRRGLSPLASINELDMKASIYEPLNVNHRCAKERCALLSLFDNTRTVFAVEPVIYLGSGTVSTLSADADN